MQKNIPLHRTTHFRKLRKVLLKLLNMENLDSRKLNMENIRCYQISGDALNGKNVIFTSFNSSKSCFISNHTYNMYEIPFKSEIKNYYEGSYLFLAYDIQLENWLFGSLTYFINSVDKFGNLHEKVVFTCFGEYSILEIDGQDLIVNRIRLHDNNYKNIPNKGTKFKKTNFDPNHIRLSQGYGKSIYKIIEEKTGRKITNSVFDKTEVKIYKKGSRK